MTPARKWTSLIILAVAANTIFQVAFFKIAYYEESISAIGLTKTEFNTITGIFGILAAIMYFFGGWFADRYRPKALIAVALAGTGIADIVLSLQPGFLGALLCFVVFAVTGMCLFWAALVKAISMLGTKDEQGRLFGYLEGIRGIAGILISMLAATIITTATIAWKGVTWAMVACGVICLICAALTWFFVYEDRERLAAAASQKVGLRQIKAAVTNKYTWLIGGTIFMVYAFYSSFGYLDPLLKSKEDFAIAAGVMAFASSIRAYGFQLLAGPIGGQLTDRWTRSGPKFLRIAFCVMLVGTGVFLLIPRTPAMGVFALVTLLVIAFVVFACRGMYWSMVGEVEIPDNERGGVIGLGSGIAYLPDAFLPFLITFFLGDSASGRAEHGGYSALLILLGTFAIFGIIISSTMIRVRRREVERQAGSGVSAPTLPATVDAGLPS